MTIGSSFRSDCLRWRWVAHRRFRHWPRDDGGVHGGPNVRGTHWQWNDEAGYLASLGYAVLQPEFRGSRGWGRKLFEAGWKQWGRAMLDDLNDGVDWLAKEGTIDPKRVCI